MIIESMLGLALSMPIDPSLKCPRTHSLPGFPEEAPVVIVDGEIRRGEAQESLKNIDPSDMHRIEIKCWNPETDELPASSGIQLILISTRAPTEHTKASTLSAADLVHAYVAEHDDVPTSAAQVDASLTGYAIEVRPLGWVLTSPDINGIECVTSQLGSKAEEVGCSNTYSVAKQALREAWEGGAQAF